MQILKWSLLSSLTFIALVACVNASEGEKKEYIVYMGDRPKNDISALAVHLKMVQEVLGSNFSDSILYNYKRSFNGFTVKLTEQEVKRMSVMDGVISVFLNEKVQLETTRSWDFVGFSQEVSRATFESDIIIGVLDTGIWPESASFSDEGMGPPPSKWRGICQSSLNFTCNNKIIGARYYKGDGVRSEDDFDSPRDSEGHGTHTASTAAGNLISMASLMGLGLGTARGAVPSARIAVYKVCYYYGCSYADILAGYDDAIADGVDIISLSLGSYYPRPYFRDPIAIGAFHAMKNGILTSSSAGNSGPSLSTTTKTSPWIMSVAASTIDRKFVTKVQLGNNEVYEGISINTFDISNTMYPIIYGGDAPNTTANYTSSTSRYCTRGTLNASLVQGKIVFCDALTSGTGAFLAGAAGTVMRETYRNDVAFSFPLPASHFDEKNGSYIFQYAKLISNATATIMKSTESNDTMAPKVASFSSRGPNPITSDILKPDLSAPGVDILASWSEASRVTGVQGDNRIVKYNIISGTSMACPHATGAAAYVKSFHPTWSPAALMSALMTTASPMSSTILEGAEFAYGSGQINPLKAADPGLIYDAGVTDYVQFLCAEKYNSTMLQLVTGSNVTCSELSNAKVWDLNYPSFALSTLSMTSISGIFSRTLTNVGSPNSTYNATVTAPTGLFIKVNPSILSFTSLEEKLTFTLTVEGTISTNISSASLVWDDGVHRVRSPIVVFIRPEDPSNK